MENEEIEDENEEITVNLKPQGISSELAVFVVLVVAVVGSVGGYFVGSRAPADAPEHKAMCIQSDALNKAQAEAQKSSIEANITQQKLLAGLQTKAMEACLSRGGTPMFVGGNVTCPKQ